MKMDGQINTIDSIDPYITHIDQKLNIYTHL